MKVLASKLKDQIKFRWHKLHQFQSSFEVDIKMGPYQLKTATTPEEILECCKLRHQIFFQEPGIKNHAGIDVDRFDQYFDHLLIKHLPTQKIIGTYRLSLIKNIKNSYTNLEFNLNHLLSKTRQGVELGRACIHPQYRKGSVIALLWRGIAEYMIQSKADALFGCSSVHSTNPREVALLFSYLAEQGHVLPHLLSFPQPAYEMHNFDMWLAFFIGKLTPDHRIEAQKLLPGLLSSYLKMGAKIASYPALDEDFQCVDFLTFAQKENILNTGAQRFFEGATSDQSTPSLNPTPGITISSH